jgi:predicted AlkP superfamily pyrophosphatase or phosphodiesterase
MVGDVAGREVGSWSATLLSLSFPQGSTTEKNLRTELFTGSHPLVRRPEDVADRGQAHSGRAEEHLDRSTQRDVGHFRWALATGDSYRSIGADLWNRERPDLLMVYIEGVDSISHLFGHLFRAGELAGELAVQQAKFGQAVERMYLYADRLVGEYLDLLGNDATLVVVSDHGFQLGAFQDDPSKTRDMRRVSEQFHSMEGIVYQSGKGCVGAASKIPRSST